MQKMVMVAISLIVLLVSCESSIILESKLTLEDYKYCKKRQKLLTGIAITKFENGRIATSTEFKGGIPNGNWFSYGYQGEVIQEGKFVPLQIQNPLITEKNIERLNINLWKEGDYSFIDVFIVGQNIFTGSVSNTIKFKKETEKLLRQKDLISKSDSINNLFVVKGELE